MRCYASDFEFRHRLWIFSTLFWAAFASYSIDSKNAAVAFASAFGGNGNSSVLRIILGGGVALSIVAAILRTWGNAYLHSKVVRDTALRTERLVEGGPFRYTRNPLYLAALFFAMGTALAVSRLGFVILVGGTWIFLYRLIGREEAGLRAGQGARYTAYCAAVPRFWPSLQPRLPQPWGGARPQWAQALLGEAWIWGFAAISAGYAVTLNQRLYLWGSPLCLFAYWLNRMAVKRRG